MDFAPAPFPRDLQAGYRAAGLHTDALIGDMMRRNATEFGSRTAVIQGSDELTWAELVDASLRLAGFLQAQGIGPGDPVVWQLPNWWESMVVAFGIWAAGAISVPVVPIFREHELTAIVGAVGPKCVITAASFRNTDHVAQFESVLGGAGAGAHPVRVVVRGAATGWIAFEDVVTASPAARGDVDPDAPSLVGFTSGTTSGATGAVMSTRATLTVPMRHVRATPYNFRDRSYMPAPVSHITGLLMAVTLPLVSGCSIVLAERWDAAQAVDDFVRHGVTFSGGATVFIQELVEAIAAAGLASFPLANGYNCGGSAIPTDLMRRCEELGLKPRRAYGMTECPTVSACYGYDPAEIRVETDGRLLPGIELRVLDAEGNDVAPGEAGEFLVRGPQRALGYLDSSHTRDAFDDDGWFRTGDLGAIDARGCVTVTGRTKDIINRGGEKLSAREIEELICRYPGVGDAAVVAAPHPRLGEEPAAFIIVRAGEGATDDDLQAFLRAEGVAPQKIPRIWVPVDEFPRTPSGKVMKYELVERLPPRAAP
jgi:acyl-CoA synthetase (AMP-forming)/AMP-acid ligase II